MLAIIRAKGLRLPERQPRVATEKNEYCGDKRSSVRENRSRTVRKPVGPIDRRVRIGTHQFPRADNDRCHDTNDGVEADEQTVALPGMRWHQEANKQDGREVEDDRAHVDARSCRPFGGHDTGSNRRRDE